jgi:hypothetical protein
MKICDNRGVMGVCCNGAEAKKNRNEEYASEGDWIWEI